MAEVALRGQALLDDIAQTQTAPGQVAFWWLGQHSFIVKGGERVLFIDPYLSPHDARQTPPLPTFRLNRPPSQRRSRQRPRSPRRRHRSRPPPHRFPPP